MSLLNARNLGSLATAIHTCEACPRLRKHCQEVAREKKKAFEDEDYWGRPIAGFGDPRARLLVVGLAPAAHGANRTGRIFTGDRSGDWLYKTLYKHGFANQGSSISRNDGLKLRDTWITCVARCAPPDNKPLPEELERCRPFLKAELKLLNRVKVFVALGQIALDGLVKTLEEQGAELGKVPKFKHGLDHRMPDGRSLLCSFHPSQQNTFTGKLTEPMFDSVFSTARERLRE